MRGRAATPEAEAARREKISAFAKTRFRDALGQYAPKIVEAEVRGWTTKSREALVDKDERVLGWDYHGPRVIRIRSASADREYVRQVLDRAFPERRYWEVTHVSER